MIFTQLMILAVVSVCVCEWEGSLVRALSQATEALPGDKGRGTPSL